MRLSVQEKNLIPFLGEVYLSFKEQAEAHNTNTCLQQAANRRFAGLTVYN